MTDAHGSSPHRLVAYLSAVVGCEDAETAAQVAADLVAEEFDAEVAAVVGGDARAVVGFGAAPVPWGDLADVSLGAGVHELGSRGPFRTLAAPLGPDRPERLVTARRHGDFDSADRHLLLAMARALGVSLDRIEVLEGERGRQRVLEVLLGVQRRISHGAPLSEVLDAVTAGAQTVLDGVRVGLRLGGDCDAPTEPGAVTAPVHIKGKRVGELVAHPAARGELDRGEAKLLRAFAEQASLALADARSAERVREAQRDAVTGLPNRRAVVDRLGEALARDRAADAVCVLFIDLDRFKAVNDSLGHGAGDELLAAAGRRIRAATRSTDVVARFGGDEFAVVVDGRDSRSRAWTVADRIIGALREPFSVDGNVVYIGATIGIAQARGTVDAEALLGDADLAMYEAKRAGGGQVRAFDPTMRVALRERLELEVALRDALAKGELRVHYQPIVALGTGATDAVEALLRWTHPEHGPVSPAVFVPLAEATGTIVPIGRWVLRETCLRLRRWRAVQPHLKAHVNVSVHQLRDPGFPAQVEAALRDHELPGEALVLEITETMLVEEQDVTTTALRELRGLGVAIGLDDFGTGYSSLSYLHRFPVDVLKIDRSFVSGDASGAGGHQLVRTIVELGRVFGVATVAEGVETAHQHEQLRDMGCDLGQGFLFSRPLDAAALETHLLSARASARSAAA